MTRTLHARSPNLLSRSNRTADTSPHRSHSNLHNTTRTDAQQQPVWQCTTNTHLECTTDPSSKHTTSSTLPFPTHNPPAIRRPQHAVGLGLAERRAVRCVRQRPVACVAIGPSGVVASATAAASALWRAHDGAVRGAAGHRQADPVPAGTLYRLAAQRVRIYGQHEEPSHMLHYDWILSCGECCRVCVCVSECVCARAWVECGHIWAQRVCVCCGKINSWTDIKSKVCTELSCKTYLQRRNVVTRLICCNAIVSWCIFV